MPLENRTRFNKKDLDLIKQGQSRVIGQFDSYNRPSFGDDPRDFIELNIYDLDDNFIQSHKITNENFSVDNGNVELKPGGDLRSLGYQSGEYKVEYNFFRELAGSESKLLIDEESNIYDGPFEFDAFGKIIASDGTNRKLELVDNKFFIHEISGDRTEVRIAPLRIKNEKYLGDFENLQSDNTYVTSDPIRLSEGFDFVSLGKGLDELTPNGGLGQGDSTLLNLELKGNDVGFTPDMVGSEISINDVYFHGNDVENSIDFAPDFFLTHNVNFGENIPRISSNFVGVKFPPLEGSNLPQVDDRPFILRGPIGENITYNIDGVSGPDILNKDQMYDMHFRKFPIGKGGNAKKELAEEVFRTNGNNFFKGRAFASLKGADQNGIYFTAYVDSSTDLQPESIEWKFTNLGRPDNNAFKGNVVSKKANIRQFYSEISKLPTLVSSKLGFTTRNIFGRSRIGKNPLLIDAARLTTTIDEFGARVVSSDGILTVADKFYSTIIQFTQPGIYDVEVAVTFNYGIRKRVLRAKKQQYFMVIPRYGKEGDNDTIDNFRSLKSFIRSVNEQDEG